MRSRERLRRIERELAAVELAAREAGLTSEREVNNLERIIVAEMWACVSIHAVALIKDRWPPIVPMPILQDVAASVVQMLADLQAATGERGQVFKARVARLLDEARSLRTLDPSLAERARPFMAELLAMVAAHESIRSAARLPGK